MNNKITAIFIVAIFLMSFGVVLAADGDVIWKREYDGNGPDYAMGVATDSYNNVIVTGYSFMGDNLDNLNYCTIKYDAAGNIIWKREYDGGDEDGAKGVATDSYNNVIVTGISEIGGRRSDYCTIKYDPNGNVVWEKEYDSGFDDFANGVATDSYNNVIVTGYSKIGGKIRYCTIKYDPNGNIIWKREYDGGDNAGANGVATDSYNNVIVTGYSIIGGSPPDYCTIKYDPNGNIIWKREYDGGDEDGAKGVATDSYNNVIVTGISEIGGRRSDYCTIKYQGVPPRSKSLPIDKFLKILKRNRCKNHPDAEDCKV